MTDILAVWYFLIVESEGYQWIPISILETKWIHKQNQTLYAFEYRATVLGYPYFLQNLIIILISIQIKGLILILKVYLLLDYYTSDWK